MLPNQTIPGCKKVSKKSNPQLSFFMLDTQFLLLNHTSTIDTKKTIINTFLFNGQVKKREFCSPCFISFYRAEAKDILGQDNEEMDERNL